MDQNPDQDGKLYRSDRIVDTIPGLSRFQQATLHQGQSLVLRVIRGLVIDIRSSPN
jgi:hypothetical protein